MTTQLDIANRALLSAGSRIQVSSISPSDGSAEANAVSVLWQPCFESLGRSAQWNCLTKQTTLAVIQAAQGTPENVTGTALPLPPLPWNYSYAYPSDCLQFRYIIPNFPSNSTTSIPATSINNAAPIWLPTGGQIPFAISTILDSQNVPIQAVLSNQGQAIGIYTASYNNPNLWDALFQDAMVATLAAFLVPALSLSLPFMQLNIGMAKEAINQARTADGREGVTVMDHLPDWIRARASGYAIGVGIYTTPTGAYQDINWPQYSG